MMNYKTLNQTKAIVYFPQVVQLFDSLSKGRFNAISDEDIHKAIEGIKSKCTIEIDENPNFTADDKDNQKENVHQVLYWMEKFIVLQKKA